MNSNPECVAQQERMGRGSELIVNGLDRSARIGCSRCAVEEQVAG